MKNGRRAEDKEEEINMYLDDNRCHFIAAERLGMLENNVAAMATTPGKRKREIEFNSIAHILKRLKVIEHTADIVGISFGCLNSGEAGMFILCKSPTKVIGNIPEIQQEPKT